MKSPRNTLIGLLAGASTLALAAVSPSQADPLQLLTGSTETVIISDDADYVELDGDFAGDVINEAIIGPTNEGSSPSNVGISAAASAIISGDLINSVDGEVSAVSVSASSASAVGINLPGTQVPAVINDGLIQAYASASSATVATAIANAFGVVNSSNVASIVNSGSISASAAARFAGAGNANAKAIGLDLSALGDNASGLDNSNLISAQANAFANGTATATAVGVSVSASGGVVSGVILNGGRIEASAAAATQSGLTIAGSANAIGISVSNCDIDCAITNTGEIVVAASGQSGSAIGIRVDGPGVGIVENDGGTIDATFDDGSGPARGTAIDVQDSNAIEIQLKGSVADGQINGDIEIGDGDVIRVSEGNTYLTGDVSSSGGTATSSS